MSNPQQPDVLQQISDDLKASRKKGAAAKDASAPPVKQRQAAAEGKGLKES